MRKTKKRKAKKITPQKIEVRPEPVPVLAQIGMIAETITDDGEVCGPICGIAADFCTIRVEAGDDDLAIKRAGGIGAPLSRKWEAVRLIIDGPARDAEPSTEQSTTIDGDNPEWWYLLCYAGFLRECTDGRTGRFKAVHEVICEKTHSHTDMTAENSPTAAELIEAIEAFYAMPDAD